LGFEKSQRSVTHDSLRYINILTYLLTYLLTYSFTHSLTHSFIHSFIHSFTQSVTHSVGQSVTLSKLKLRQSKLSEPRNPEYTEISHY